MLMINCCRYVRDAILCGFYVKLFWFLWGENYFFEIERKIAQKSVMT